MRFFVDEVANAVMSTAFHPVIVLAVESVVSKSVLLPAAVVGTAVSRFQKREPEAIPHGHPKRTRVHIEAERWRGDSIKPVASVRKSERQKTGFVTS